MILRFGDHRLAPALRELRHGARTVPLPRRAYDCLAYLLERRDRAVGRDELIAALWGHVHVTDAQLGQLILRLRRALGDDGERQATIRTVTGYGYRWVMPVEVEEAATPDAAADIAPSPNGAAPDGIAAPPATAAPEATASPAAAPTPDTPSSDVPLPAASPTAAAAPVRAGRFSRRLRRVAVVALLGIAATAAALLLRPRAPAPAAVAPDAVAYVLPLDVDAPRDAQWVRLGAMDLVADRLRGGGLAVPPSENVLRQLAADPAAATHLAAPGRWVVTGRARRAGARWQVELDARGEGAPRHAGAEDADAMLAARRAADGLLAALGRRPAADDVESERIDARLRRAEAALLANELDTARAILLETPGDAAQSQVRYRLAQLDYRAGDLARAASELGALLEEPGLKSDPLLRAQVLSARGTVGIHRNDYAAAARDFDAAVALLGDGTHPAELGRALNGRGAAAIGRGDLDHAVADLGLARVQLERGADELGVARVDNNLAALEAERARPAAARGYFAAAAERFAAYGAVNEQLIALSGENDVEIALLSFTDALATSDRAWALRERASDPALRLDLGVNRVRTLLALGRGREADALVQELLATAAPDDGVATARAQAVRSQAALAAGRHAEAADAAQRALRLLPPEAPAGLRADLVLWAQRALIAQQRYDATAAQALAAYVAGADGLANVAVADAERARWRGDAASAEAAWRRALEVAESRGIPGEIAEVAQSYAGDLIAHGELERAATVAGRVGAWAGQDYDCALLTLRLYHALGQPGPWVAALRRTLDLAGERSVPPPLLRPPGAG